MSQVDQAALWDGFELSHGTGRFWGNKVCIMQVVDYVTANKAARKGKSLKDRPNCTDPAIGTALIILNDYTSSREERNKLLQFIHRVIGTKHFDALSEENLKQGFEGTYQVFGEMLWDAVINRLNGLRNQGYTGVQHLPSIGIAPSYSRCIEEYELCKSKETYRAKASIMANGVSNSFRMLMAHLAEQQGINESKILVRDKLDYDPICVVLDQGLPAGPVFWRGENVVQNIYEAVEEWRRLNHREGVHTIQPGHATVAVPAY